MIDLISSGISFTECIVEHISLYQDQDDGVRMLVLLVSEEDSVSWQVS